MRAARTSTSTDSPLVVQRHPAGGRLPVDGGERCHMLWGKGSTSLVDKYSSSSRMNHHQRFPSLHKEAHIHAL